MKIKKFYLDGCTPCMAVTGVLKAMNLPNKEVEIEEIKMNGKEDEYIDKYDLNNVPTLVFYKSSQEVGRLEGWITELDINLMLKKGN